jgi:SAM-dependent methyltransferase
LATELLRLLPHQGLMLEVASGTGQHAAHLAALLPGWQWQPTDADPGALASISAWCEGLANVRTPLLLDVTAPAWPGVPDGVDAAFCANMIHISPWAACGGLLHGAARHLSPSGVLVLYGPYFEEGVAAAPSNLVFDASLRERNPAWGIRRLPEVLAVARAAGLQLRERVAMPANNLLLVLDRSA